MTRTVRAYRRLTEPGKCGLPRRKRHFLCVPEHVLRARRAWGMKAHLGGADRSGNGRARAS